MAITDTKFRRLTLENVNRAPRKRGVYALYESGRLLYLGAAEGGKDTIRSRLRKHLAGDDQGAMRYKREPSENPQARLETLLSEYVAAHGAPPAKNARPV